MVMMKGVLSSLRTIEQHRSSNEIQLKLLGIQAAVARTCRLLFDQARHASRSGDATLWRRETETRPGQPQA